MSPQRWQQIKHLLCNALEREEGERESYLAQACGADSDLRLEVEELLKAQPETMEEFALNMRASLGRRIWVNPVGQQLGAYRITEEIGRGGMGRVFLAERADGQFEKKVAIKILKRGTDTEEILARFQVERQILARLEHPNIARLIDAGTTNDLPYFIMEYAPGIPVTRFVRDKHLSLPERLQLFLKISAAVASAHENSIVHRDLKPSNILVSSAGEPKLLDFGIAKLIRSAPGMLESTVLEKRRYTPGYSSPEQTLGGTVTFSADIYALGTLLYEMLAEHNPHHFSDPDPSQAEVRRVVGKIQPRPPSHVAPEPELQRQLKGSLDRIILRALEKDPERRYPSVTDLSNDVRGFFLLKPSSLHSTGNYSWRRWHHGERKLVVVIVIGLLTLTGALTYMARNHIKGPAASSAQRLTASEKSIAILPFTNLSSDPQNAFFTDGVQSEILTELAKVADLKVISRVSVMRYQADRARNLREIGQLLGVAHLLQGSVQRVANRVRVNIELFDARTDTQIWAQHYDRDLADVFAIQSEIARTVARQLRAKLSPAESVLLSERPTEDLAAYDLYLRGNNIIDSYLDADDPKASLLDAIQLLDQATAIDSNFALAYAASVRAHDLLYFLELDLDPHRILLAETALKAAMRLRPDAGEVHLAAADYYFRCYRDYARAREELALARPKLPNSVPLFVLSGYIERREGLWNDATQSFATAVELDPANVNAINLLADQYVLLHQFGKASAVYQRALGAGLGSPVLHFRLAWTRFEGDGNILPLQQALQSVPSNLDVGGGQTPWRILVCLVQHDYEGATQALHASSRQDFQNTDFSFYYPRSWYEATIARAQGDLTAAKTAFGITRNILASRLKTRPEEARTLAVLGEVDAGLGNQELALKEGRHAAEIIPVTRDSYEGALILQSLAQIYTWTGEQNNALDVIKQLIEMPGYLSYGNLRVDPAWNPLRDNPRFATLLNQAKAAQSGSDKE